MNPAFCTHSSPFAGLALALAGFGLGAALLFPGSRLSAKSGERDGDAIPPLAMKYCTACHLPPRPGALTSDSWPISFGIMANWIKERDLPFEDREYSSLLKHYVANSPEKFEPIPDYYEDSTLEFQQGTLGLPCVNTRPRITNVNVTDLDGDGRADVLVCDDVSDRVSWLVIDGTRWTETPLASIESPVRTHVFDYDGNGHLDIVVAALGFLEPTDDLLGSAWLLRNRGDQTFEQVPLIENVARICDIKPGDFTGNGLTDFAVVMFGWRTTGGVMILEQVAPDQFERRDIIELNGAMQLEVVDFNDNGRDDIVVLFSQEHERIVLFQNEGNGEFSTRVLVQALHPAYGSSGFQLVELDGDGDVDILMTNGDMMDEISLAKPYHGVRWFENIDGEFRIRELARMTGCYRAVAHDMNGNGHLDIVVSSLNFFWDESDAPSLIWLENDGEQNFTPRRIAYAPSNLATMDVGDINHDGKPDIIVGGLHVPGPLGREGRLTAFFQIGPVASEE